MKLLLVSHGKHSMENIFLEETPATRFNEIMLKNFERTCQIFGVQVVLTRDLKIDLMETIENKYYALQPGMTFGKTDIVKNIELSPKTFKTRQNFYTTINDEIMAGKVALMAFKLDDNGFMEISGDGESECIVVMHLVPKKQIDITSTHAGSVMNIFHGRPDVTNIEFFPDKKGLIISFQKASTAIYGNGKSVPDKVWQEKHEIVDGVLVHTETRYGAHHPQETVHEHTTWEQDWNKVTR